LITDYNEFVHLVS